MTLGIEMPVEGVSLCAGGVVGDHGEGALSGDGLAQAIAVIGGIGHDNLGRQSLDEGIGYRGISLLAGREREAHWAAQPADGQVDLGAQAASGAAEGLIRNPLFAPAAC